jgi:hypothetical protein
VVGSCEQGNEHTELNKFGVLTIRRISILTKELLTSQERMCSKEFVGY